MNGELALWQSQECALVLSHRIEGKVCVGGDASGSVGSGSALAFGRDDAFGVGRHRSVDQAQADLELVRGTSGHVVSKHPVDVLFSVAATAHFSRLEDLSDEEWDLVRRAEVDFLYLSRPTETELAGRRDGAMNVASVNALLSGGSRVNPISFRTIPTGATLGQLEDPERTSPMVGRSLPGRRGRPEGVANDDPMDASDGSSYRTGAEASWSTAK